MYHFVYTLNFWKGIFVFSSLRAYRVAINIHVQISAWTQVFSFLWRIPRNRMAEFYVWLYGKLLICFPEWLYYFASSPAVWQFLLLPILNHTWCFYYFYFSHSNDGISLWFLLCISLIANDTWHFSCIIAINIFASVVSIQSLLAFFSTGLFFFFSCWIWVLFTYPEYNNNLLIL